jgi:mannose-6-phosphate isomerase-like protein (cupin superfamily)
MHDGYRHLVERAAASHEQGRSAEQISDDDVSLARLYSYAYRIHTIGSFHATRKAIESLDPPDELGRAYLQRAAETLEDLTNQGMETVPDDFRVVVSTFYRYDRGVQRALDALRQAHDHSGNTQIGTIREHFAATMSRIRNCNGLHLTQDIGPHEQASFIVPNLGISIVPLVYGDHHSWNFAALNEQHLDVPWHRHRHSVEIHLGFEPLEGYMILDQCKSPVSAGYALPIPPMTRHGWKNTTTNVHGVPFVYGSLSQAGWGVFLDVEPQPMELDDMQAVDRDGWQMGNTVYLVREFEAMAKLHGSRRRVLVPASATDRNGSGGLELAVTRANESGFTFARDGFRALSVVKGRGVATVGPVTRQVTEHDHFAVPAGMDAALRQHGDEPLVVLDALLKSAHG